MKFDIHTQLIDDRGQCDRPALYQYLDQLAARFTASPEGAALCRDGGYFSWSYNLLRCCVIALGLHPTEMQPGDFFTVVFDIFPEVAVAKPAHAPAMIRELCVFLEFLHREFGLDNALACREVLDETAAGELQARLADPQRFSEAKWRAMTGEAPPDRASADLIREDAIRQLGAIVDQVVKRDARAKRRMTSRKRRRRRRRRR